MGVVNHWVFVIGWVFGYVEVMWGILYITLLFLLSELFGILGVFGTIITALQFQVFLLKKINAIYPDHT